MIGNQRNSAKIDGDALVETLENKWKEMFKESKKPYDNQDYYNFGRMRGYSEAICEIRKAQSD